MFQETAAGALWWQQHCGGYLPRCFHDSGLQGKLVELRRPGPRLQEALPGTAGTVVPLVAMYIVKVPNDLWVMEINLKGLSVWAEAGEPFLRECLLEDLARASDWWAIFPAPV